MISTVSSLDFEKGRRESPLFPRNYYLDYRIHRNFAQNKIHINKPKEVILSSPFVQQHPFKCLLQENKFHM